MEENKIIIGDLEIGLYYCNGAAKELGKLVNGLSKLGDYLNIEDTDVLIDRIEHITLILNKWYCAAVACNGKKSEPVTMETLDLLMDPNEVATYGDAILEAIKAGTKKSIQVKPVPQKNVKSGRKQSS